jgi:hypothetical protein
MKKQEEEGYYMFKLVHDDGSKVVVKFHTEQTLTTMLENFETFLRASGYVFKGTLDIVDEDVNE